MLQTYSYQLYCARSHIAFSSSGAVGPRPPQRLGQETFAEHRAGRHKSAVCSRVEHSMSVAALSAQVRRAVSFQSMMLALSQAAMLATIVVLAWERNWELDLPGFDPTGVPFS